MVDLDDNGTPLADGEDIADSDTHQAGFLSTTGGKIAIAAAIAAAVATVWAILKRRGEYEEDDDYEEEDGE